MKRPVLAAAAAVALAAPAAGLGFLVRWGLRRMIFPPRADLTGLGPLLDILGGEVVRLRARDGLAIAGRWLPAEAPDGGGWRPEPAEAILLVHGHGASIASDLIESGPFLRRTAGVLGIDLRGHGLSDDAPSGLGLDEIEDVAGALSWLGQRGIRRVALVGTSLGAIVSIAALAILGDGSLIAADADPFAPAVPTGAIAPSIVGLVADSATPTLALPVAAAIDWPLARLYRRPLARLGLWAVARRLGGDPRDVEPGRVASLLAPVPVLLIHGDVDELMPLADTRRLAEAIGPTAELWVVPGARHALAHRTAGEAYERRVEAFLRGAFAAGRDGVPIIAATLAPPSVTDPVPAVPATRAAPRRGARRGRGTEDAGERDGRQDPHRR